MKNYDKAKDDCTNGRLRDKLWTKIIANVTSNPLSVTSGATLTPSRL